MRWLKTVLISGALFLLPLLLIALLLVKAFDLALYVIQPIEDVLPRWTVIGVAMPHLTALLVLLLLCLLAGLFLLTQTGLRLRTDIERATIGKIPGYTMLRTLLAGGAPDEKHVQVGLVEMENMRVLAFVMERHPNGDVTLFVPSAPTPAVGSVFIAREDQVQIIDMSLKEAMLCISRLGVGAEKLLALSTKR